MAVKFSTRQCECHTSGCHHVQMAAWCVLSKHSAVEFWCVPRHDTKWILWIMAGHCSGCPPPCWAWAGAPVSKSPNWWAIRRPLQCCEKDEWRGQECCQEDSKVHLRSTNQAPLLFFSFCGTFSENLLQWEARDSGSHCWLAKGWQHAPDSQFAAADVAGPRDLWGARLISRRKRHGHVMRHLSKVDHYGLSYGLAWSHGLGPTTETPLQCYVSFCFASCWHGRFSAHFRELQAHHQSRHEMCWCSVGHMGHMWHPRRVLHVACWKQVPDCSCLEFGWHDMHGIHGDVATDAATGLRW